MDLREFLCPPKLVLGIVARKPPLFTLGSKSKTSEVMGMSDGLSPVWTVMAYCS